MGENLKLSDVGERALVELARAICAKGPKVEVGIGDDAAAIDIDGRYLVVTTDMLVAGWHFPPGTTAEQMGLKAVIVNLSDLAAMGAEPLGLVFSVGLPRDLDVEFVRKMIRGMDATARKYGTYVVGGDLDESEEIIIAGAAFGLARKRMLLTRSGAKPGNIVAVTGSLGAAAAGLKILLERLPSRGYEGLIKAQLEPSARVKEGMALAG
ncbi:MAG: thiamine-phosphate kinase, partial [Hadesarchaea archaeon]|nr:thiamine-phosphate kinase [Hadesarchaea archaeon]